MKKLDGKDQKLDIFTKGIQGCILLHIIKLLCVW